jgi:MYXO-CTERM domain-containing protein
MPKYDLPCQTADDCGDGFTCVHEQSCECSGGSAAADAGVATSGGGSNPGTPTPAPSGSGSSKPAPAPAPIPVPDPAPDCTCTTSATARCEAKSIVCTTDAVCPSGWTCVAEPQATPGCAEPAHVIGFDGGTTIPVCDPPPTTPPVSDCVPPYYRIGGNVGLGASGSAPETGTSTPGGATGSAGSTSDPGVSNSGDGTATNGNDGASGAKQAASDSSAKSDGGCDVAPGRHTSSGAAVFSLLGLLAVVRRRRRVA